MTTGCTATYLRLKTRVSNLRFGALCTFGWIVGALCGQIQRANAHVRFVSSLNDRNNFFQALRNVHARLDDNSVPGFGIQDPRRTERTDVHGDTSRPNEGDAAWAAAEPMQREAGVNTSSPSASPSRPPLSDVPVYLLMVY